MQNSFRCAPMLTVAEHGSKPRDNALCTVCCIETIYMSLRDTTNRAFLNRTLLPYAFVYQRKNLPASRLDCYAFTRFAPAVFARSSATKQSNNLYHSATCHCPTWSGNLLSKSYDMVCCFHMKWENHKIWFVSSAWSGQTTKCGLLVSLEVSKPQNVVCYFHLKWANR